MTAARDVLLRADTAGNVHDRASLRFVGRQIAALLGGRLIEDLPASAPAGAYWLPVGTLSAAEADAFGIVSERDFFGGAVPYDFVATKAVSHPLVSSTACAPEGWSRETEIGRWVLDGFTAFSLDDARAAGEALLANGPVRLKQVGASAGVGQVAASDRATLAQLLAEQDPATVVREGLVIEENLLDPVTYSVGWSRIGGETIAYWGTQQETRRPQGDAVYGGSELHAVRGDPDALLAEDLPTDVVEAVRLAIGFDDAVSAAYPGILASRRNYDVLVGQGAGGSRRMGVLEQSWRAGGASPAELLAFRAFRSEPKLRSVRCATVERHALVDVPADAEAIFHGVDPVVGAMTKYAMLVR
ncbi:DUF3182 family protein [Sphingomonas sp. ac-8]|uniref:DUF3182 family protein n=1 Tax=Sphingomonas sp. ac-8 TaxID=3242977 RepID=UPI003A7F85BE